MCSTIGIVKNINFNDLSNTWLNEPRIAEIETQKEFQEYFKLEKLYFDKGYNETSLEPDMCLCPIDLEKQLSKLGFEFRVYAGEFLVKVKN